MIPVPPSMSSDTRAAWIDDEALLLAEGRSDASRGRWSIVPVEGTSASAVHELEPRQVLAAPSLAAWPLAAGSSRVSPGAPWRCSPPATSPAASCGGPRPGRTSRFHRRSFPTGWSPSIRQAPRSSPGPQSTEPPRWARSETSTTAVWSGRNPIVRSASRTGAPACRRGSTDSPRSTECRSCCAPCRTAGSPSYWARAGRGRSGTPSPCSTTSCGLATSRPESRARSPNGRPGRIRSRPSGTAGSSPRTAGSRAASRPASPR